MSHSNRASPEKIQQIANQLRILSIRSTTLAGSGHPTSCASAADLVAALFFGHMRFDPANPKYPGNDRFVLSKGHGAPLLYAAWAETGHFSESELDGLRKLDSDFEGHPTPRLDFVDCATGSLGMGLSMGAGMALNAKMRGLKYRTYVLLGDGEMAEGSVWEAASFAGLNGLDHLVALIDVNRLGQSGETAMGWDLGAYVARMSSFGWEAVAIDGHSVPEILDALEKASTREHSRKPFAIVAKTLKGKGIPCAEGKEGWHGKALSREQAKEAIDSLQTRSSTGRDVPIEPPPGEFEPEHRRAAQLADPVYPEHKPVATRKAFGNALVRVGMNFPELVVFDGDVGNSTHTEEFRERFPLRFVECYISEQNMVGMAEGLCAMGPVGLCSTFGAFFSRAMDQIRMAGISRSNLKLVGTHTGVSIGEDGPSQMALEDIASMRAIQGSVVLCPSDAISCERLVEKILEHKGLCYLRTARPATPILYRPDERFEIGGAKVLRRSEQDQVTLVACGVPVFEALKAWERLALEGIHVTVIDAYSIKPLAAGVIADAASKTGWDLITVEDHYPQGGLGDAVAGELSRLGARVRKLAVGELPRSGKEMELMARYRIDATAISATVRELLEQRRKARERAEKRAG